MTSVLRSAVAVGVLGLGLGLGAAEAGKGPKKPEVPFTIRVDTAGKDQETVDSANDVRRAIEKKPDWFRLVESRDEADMVLVITGRNFSQEKALIVYGRLTTANVTNAEIIGQCIPGIFDVTGPWKSAAGNMVKRVENFARATYDDLAAAQKNRTAASAAAGR
jgi:hypothetical protein